MCNWLKKEKLHELEQLFRDQEIDGYTLLTATQSEWQALIPILGKRFEFSFIISYK